MVTNTREVFYTTTTNKHDAVLLEIMTFSRDVRIDFLTIVRRTRATLRIAELGFLGVVVYTRTHTPTNAEGKSPSDPENFARSGHDIFCPFSLIVES